MPVSGILGTTSRHLSSFQPKETPTLVALRQRPPTLHDLQQAEARCCQAPLREDPFHGGLKSKWSHEKQLYIAHSFMSEQRCDMSDFAHLKRAKAAKGSFQGAKAFVPKWPRALCFHTAQTRSSPDPGVSRTASWCKAYKTISKCKQSY